MKIFIIGSSYVHRLENSILRNSIPNSRIDFGTGQDIRFFGIGGARVGTLRCSGRLESLLQETKPDLVILHIGGNDADSHKSAAAICADILDYVGALKTKFQIPRIYISQLLYRQVTRRISVHIYNTKIHEINKKLTNNQLATFWRHRGLIRPQKQILTNDGVHLNTLGQELFYRSMKRAVCAAMGGRK